MDSEMIDPKKNDPLQGSPNEEINRAPFVATHRYSLKSRVYINGKEQKEHQYCSPPTFTPGFWQEKTDRDCYFQNTGEVNRWDSEREKRRQHLGHWPGLNEVSSSGKHKQEEET
jgi:hypothetical protein